MIKLWQEAMATGTFGWQWIVRTDTYSPEGSIKDGRVIYENLKVLVVKDDKMRVTRSKGTIVEEYLYIILPKFQLAEDSLVPEVNNTFFKKGNDLYKVIGVLDKTDNPEFFCYYLTLRRDNIK